MEENNKFETDTGDSGSGSILYGAGAQPQGQENGYSALYDTKAQDQTVVQQQDTTPVQLTKPTEPVSGQQSTAPVQLTKLADSVSGQQSTVPVQLSKPTESVSGQQSTAPVQLTKPTELAPGQQGTAPVQLTNPAASAQQPQSQWNQYGNGQPQGQWNPSGNSQPQGQNPYGPIQPPPPMQGAPAPKPKKNKAGIVAGILCAAAVLLVIVAGVLLAKSFLGGNAEQQLAKGFANMAKEMAAYQNSLAGDIGLEQLKEIFPVHTNIDLSITDPNASGELSNVNIEVDAVMDYSGKKAAFDLGVGAYGFSVDIAELVAANNTLYVSAPMLFEDVYSLDLTNLGKDFNRSVWADIIGETMPEDYSLTLFPNTDQSDDSGQSGEKDALQKIFQWQTDSSEDSTQYEVIKQKKEFTIGGTSVACGGVRATLNKDAFNESFEAMRDEFLASEYYAELMKGYEAAYVGDFAEFEEYMEEFVETMFDIRLEQDAMLDFYMDKKGRIVNISTPEDIAVSGQRTEVDSIAVDINFAGTERAMDSIEGGIYVQSGGEILYMGISRTAELTQEYYDEDLKLSIQSDYSDEELTFRYQNTWGYADHSFDLKMILEAPDSSMEISADGAFTDIVEEVSYTFRIDHSAITIDGEDLLLLTGSVTTEPAVDAVEVPEDAINILEMSESEIMSLLYGYSSLY